ncbi:ExbD/TolR family protein [Pedobacter xixiisoli]|uniref:Outer membrane transport energization protein ExbD n=1 Tax=Pedobacter xixiisoli TaxID=1476464 RepID=A0A286ADY8_9SPHI|nr:biopolymer transporter ExbD [Pedobacter xixiisoli]SOD20119.1 outer membrane transport energization protein ExbD [Pedobacter xixiisoli]
MAELDTSSGGGKGGKVRSKKQSTKVDLTAMVDLAFLLITFFMLTTSLSKPQAMDIAKPDKDAKDENRLELRESQTMTILLGKNDRIAWYMGEAGKTPPTIEGFNDIRASLLKNKEQVKKSSGRDIVIIVKPTDGAKYKNFVDIMDEINITKTNINAPAVDDDPTHLLASERDFMKSKGLL